MRCLPGERRKRPARLHYFATLLKDGKFCSPTWSQALVGTDPLPYRGDGQHTSHVLAHCDQKAFPGNLKVTINTYHLDSIEEDGADFFDLFDNPRSSRTNGDKLSIYMAQCPDVKDMDPVFLGKILTGIHYFRTQTVKQQVETSGGTGIVLPPKRNIGLYLGLKSEREFVLWSQRFSATTHSWMMGKPGIAAEIFSNWKSHPNVATDFWDEVFNESNPDSEDETRELIRTFLDWNHRTPQTTQDKFRNRAKKTWERYRKNANNEMRAEGLNPVLPTPGPSFEASL